MSNQNTVSNSNLEVLPEGPKRNYRKASLSFRLMRFLIGGLLKALFKFEVRGLENLPKAGGYIFAGNHLNGWLDPMMMLAFAPAEPRIYFIAAREDVESPAWRKFITEKVGGVIPIDRAKPNAYREIINRVAEALLGGGVLGVFPEGDVSAIETGRILPLKKGIGHFATQSGVPIVPVAFSGTKQPWLGKPILMLIGQPIAGQTGGRSVADELTRQTAQAILAILPAPALENPRDRKLLKKFFTNLFIQPGHEKAHPTPD